MLLRFGKLRGFLYCFEALLGAGVLVSALGALGVLGSADFGFGDELLFQAGQDALEVCSKKNDLSRACLERVVGRVNPSLRCFEHCGEDGFLFERRYFSGFVLRLRVCY